MVFGIAKVSNCTDDDLFSQTLQLYSTLTIYSPNSIFCSASGSAAPTANPVASFCGKLWMSVLPYSKIKSTFYLFLNPRFSFGLVITHPDTWVHSTAEQNVGSRTGSQFVTCPVWAAFLCPFSLNMSLILVFLDVCQYALLNVFSLLLSFLWCSNTWTSSLSPSLKYIQLILVLNFHLIITIFQFLITILSSQTQPGNYCFNVTPRQPALALPALLCS